MKSHLRFTQFISHVFILLLLCGFIGPDRFSRAEEHLQDTPTILNQQIPRNQPVSLSPADWEEGELEKYTALQNTFSPSHPVEESQLGMISGTSSALAVRSGFEALKKGGTAADAAMATALAQVALVAGSYVSYAGIMFVTYYDATEQKVYYMNAGFNTPLYEDDPLSIPASEPSGRTVMVPGFFAGLEAIHEAFGNLPFKTIFKPAIYFAEEGFELNAVMGSYIDYRKDVLSRLPETKAIFTKEDGEFYSAGDWFKQPLLAETLEGVANQGAAYIYEGAWAQSFVDAVQGDGGKITMEDMQRYGEIWSDPIRTTYGDYEIFAPGLPSAGGVNTVEAINILDISDLDTMGSYTKNPEAFFWFTQAHRLMVLGFLSPETLSLLTDYDLSPESRATRETAEQLWEDMKNGDLVFTTVPNKDLLSTIPASSDFPRLASLDPRAATHSDSIVAVDQWGNIASVTHTINTVVWGKTGIFVNGISIPDAANFQQQRIKDTGPGNRLPEETNPLIVFRNNQPYLASSTIGITHYRLIAPLYTMLEYNKDVDEAFEAPFLLYADYSRARGIRIGRKIRERVIRGDFDRRLIRRARCMGLKVKQINVADHLEFRGYWVAIQIAPESGILKGVTSEHLNGVVLGY